MQQFIVYVKRFLRCIIVFIFLWILFWDQIIISSIIWSIILIYFYIQAKEKEDSVYMRSNSINLKQFKGAKTKIVTFQPGVGILTVYPGSLDYFIPLDIFSTKILFHQPFTFYPNLLLGGGEFCRENGYFC